MKLFPMAAGGPASRPTIEIQESSAKSTGESRSITLTYDARPLQPQTCHWGPGVVVQNILTKLPPAFRLVGIAHKFPMRERWNIRTWPAIPKFQKLFFEVSPLLAEHSNVYWGTNHVIPQTVFGPSVVTVHDLLILNRVWGAKFDGYLRRRFLSSVRRSTKVVTDSETTANDLLLYFPELKNRIEVALLGFDSPQLPSGSSSDGWNFNCPYVIMLGCHHPRKNLDLAFAAVKWLREAGRKLDLVITNDIHPSFQSLIRKSPNWLRCLGVLPKGDVFALLKGALALVFPSLYEGFGLPLLEAMAADCPVLALDTPINREIVGEGGWLLPNDSSKWSAAIGTLADSLSVANEMRERGRKNLLRFSWDKTARIYDQIFRTVAR